MFMYDTLELVNRSITLYVILTNYYLLYKTTVIGF